MRWVEFDVVVAQALVQRCQAAAEVLRAQGYWRRNAVENALEDFHGVYSLLFADASRLESEDRVGLARGLDDVAEQVRDVISAAEREEERQERVYQASVREQQWGKDSPFAWGVPFVDDVPISPPAIGVSFYPRIRSRLAGRHNGGGKVGARPEMLRAFVEYARGANTALVGQVREVERAWVSFTGACAWANAGALTLLDGADGFIAENRLDEGWIETVAAAFDKAGSAGFITEVELSVAVAALDPAYARGLLLDETLTLQQLTLVVSRLCVDPGLASIVAEHTNGVLKGLTLDSDSDQVLRVSALLKGLSTSGPASAALLTALKAEGLIDRVGLAGGYAYMGSGDEGGAFAQALRMVFRSGERHLASVDPALSRAYAVDMVAFINQARLDGRRLFNDDEALSYLLYGSTLSTPFLVAMGSELEAREKRFIQGGAGWQAGVNKPRAVAGLFPEGKAAMAFDPLASYMSALGNNPTAAHSFFTGGGEERVRYWVEKRHWGHDNFDGLLAALDAAIAMGDNAGQPSSARLASSMVEYLANRTQGVDVAGNPLKFGNDLLGFINRDEAFTPNTVGITGAKHLAHILGTHMPAIDIALYKEAEGATAGEVWDEVSRHDLGSLTNLPMFKREDLELMIRVAACSDEGLATLRTALTRYEDSHLATVVDRHYVGTDQKTWRFNGNFESIFESALGNQGKLEAFFIDQIGDQQVAAGREADERIRAWIGLGKDLAEEIPVDKIPLVGQAADFLAGQALDAGAQGLEESLARHEDLALENKAQQAEESFEARMNAIVKTLYDAGHITRDDVIDSADGNGFSEQEVDTWLATSFPSSDGIAEDRRDNLEIVVKDLAEFKGHLAAYEHSYKIGYLEGHVKK